MVTQQLRKIFLGPVASTMGLGLGVGLGIALGAWMLAPRPVSALSDTSQIITGGGSPSTLLPPDNVRYLAPGTALNRADEAAVQIPLFRGTLRSLRVNLTADMEPAGGSFVLMVRKNGADTNLSCTMTTSGICIDNSRVGFANGALLSIQTINTLQNAGNSVFTYVIQYD